MGLKEEKVKGKKLLVVELNHHLVGPNTEQYAISFSIVSDICLSYGAC